MKWLLNSFENVLHMHSVNKNGTQTKSLGQLSGGVSLEKSELSRTLEMTYRNDEDDD